MKIFKNIFNKIISLDNLFLVWAEFCKNKQKKPDVQKFEYFLEQNIFVLYRQLSGLNYQHDSYKRFHIYDPKYRIIHKATVKDRLVHHLVFKELCQVFEPIFIHHSYSSRIGKGVHLALNNLAISLFFSVFPLVGLGAIPIFIAAEEAIDKIKVEKLASIFSDILSFLYWEATNQLLNSFLHVGFSSKKIVIVGSWQGIYSKKW